MEGYQERAFDVSCPYSQGPAHLNLMKLRRRTLLEAAEKLKWPMKVDYASASPEDRKAFELAFYNLLKLQTNGEKIRDSSKCRAGTKESLYPIQALVRGIALRFKFHFEGTRPTNRLDKVGQSKLSFAIKRLEQGDSRSGTSPTSSTSRMTTGHSWNPSSRLFFRQLNIR